MGVAAALAAVAAGGAAVAVLSSSDDAAVPGAGVEVAALIAKGSERPPPERNAGPRGFLAERLANAAIARSNGLLEQQVRGAIATARREGGTAIGLVEELTVAQKEPGGEPAARFDRRTEFGSPRVLPVLRQEGPWVEVMAPELDNDETAWVHAGALELGSTDFALHADLSQRRLEVRRDGRILRRMTVGVGASGTSTPTGEFAVTDKLNIPGGNAAYGCCALALSGRQPHIPQDWPGGDRLAVHGTSHTETIGNAASLGCFRVRDAEARWLIETVPLGARIEIAE